MPSLRCLTAIGFFAAIGAALAIGLAVSTTPAPHDGPVRVGAKLTQFEGALALPEGPTAGRSPISKPALGAVTRATAARVPRILASRASPPSQRLLGSDTVVTRPTPSYAREVLPNTGHAERKKRVLHQVDIAIRDEPAEPAQAKLHRRSTSHAITQRWPARKVTGKLVKASTPVTPCPEPDVPRIASHPAAPIHCLAVRDPGLFVAGDVGTQRARPKPDAQSQLTPDGSLACPSDYHGAMSSSGNPSDKLLESPVSYAHISEPSDNARMHPVVTEIDIRPPRIAIETLTLRVELDPRHRSGIDFRSVRDQAGRDLGSSMPGPQPGNATAEDCGLHFDVLSGNPAVLLDALRQVGHPQVIAAPPLAVLGDQPVEIRVGQQAGHVDATVAATSAGRGVAGMDTGTRLRLRSWISREGMLHMEVCAELSNPAASEEPAARPLRKREPVTTETTVPDGCTLVLSGPVRDERSTASAEVPVLGQLPLFGKLFRFTTVTTRRNELLVLITPHVVYDRDAREVVGRRSGGNPAAMSPKSVDPRVQYVRGLLADSEGRVAELARQNPRNPQPKPTNEVRWASDYTTQEVDTPTPLLNLPARP